MLFLLPPLVVRASTWWSPLASGRLEPGSRGFLHWWFTAQWQVIFTRLPMLEETIRMIPGLYSLWLRLWGARVGALVYWSPGVVILDRPLVRIGKRVIFGVGARLNPHVLAPNGPRRMALYLSPITIGDDALVGGYSLLLPGCEVAEGEVTPPFRTIHAFSRFANGRRAGSVASGASGRTDHDGGRRVTDAFGRIASCARANWKMKAALSAGLTLFFCVPYFTLQRLTLFPARTLPLSAIDRAIDFDPRWVWAYQSVYLLLTIVPWMVTTRPELRRYARGFLLLSGVGFVFFLLMPVRGPRPDIEAADVMFRILQWYDRPLNCFPSLHVGLAVYTVLFATSVSRGRMTPAARWSVSVAGVALDRAHRVRGAGDETALRNRPPGRRAPGVRLHWWTWHSPMQRLRPARGERSLRAPQRERVGVGPREQ